MRLYLVSLGAGLVVGVIYSLLNVRSPAPPVVALIGLLGILVGEQIVPVAKRVIAGETLSLGWLKSECSEHVFGALPSRPASKSAELDSPGSTRS